MHHNINIHHRKINNCHHSSSKEKLTAVLAMAACMVACEGLSDEQLNNFLLEEMMG